jgi:uncharacterized membrane protein required for colicin V production
MILLGIGLYAFLGYKDGVFKKFLAIAGFWGGLIVATKAMYPLGKLFLDWFSTGAEASNVLAFYLTFMLITGAEYVLVKRYAQSTDLKIGMRLGGIFLGILQGAMVISLVLILLAVVDIPSDKNRNDSVTYESFFHLTPKVFDYTASWLPATKTFLEEMESNIKKLKRIKKS